MNHSIFTFAGFNAQLHGSDVKGIGLQRFIFNFRRKGLERLTLERSNIIFHSLIFARSRGKGLKTEGESRGFQPSRGTLRMSMNDKIMFDRYYCINSANHSENEKKTLVHYIL